MRGAILILSALTLACLAPFVDKAFHIDDTLFVWGAHHLQQDPVNFYGFNVNWDGQWRPMSIVTQNPPMTCYYMALVATLFGWSEVVLHAAFLLPALGVVVGTFYLGRRLCSHPFAAALMTLVSPVFLLSSTSVMCDTMMLAFWVWSVVFWIDGLAAKDRSRLAASGLLISACCLTKYFGISLLPLLLLYSLLERKRLGRWIFALAIPVLVMALYQATTYHLYGRGLLFHAMSYATQNRIGDQLPLKLVTGWSFMGGCLVILLSAAPWLWSRKALAGGTAAFVLTAASVVALKKVNMFQVVRPNHIEWSFVAQFALYVVVGASLLVLAVADWRAHKTPVSALLLFWILGTYFFATGVNWTVAGRNILPMTPAACILIVRRLEQRNYLAPGQWIGRLWMPLGFSLVVALIVTWSDYRWANSIRASARAIREKIGNSANGVWFEGHWGFQYYMEQQGAQPLDRENLFAPPNAAVIIPWHNSDYFELSTARLENWFMYRGGGPKWLTTMSVLEGAGFYADGWGPLPFVFCHVLPDEYLVLRVKKLPAATK